MSNLREQMECYRPGLDDLSEPELAALNEALDADPSARHDSEMVQAWDSAISQAITDVPIPEGLADRLAASLEGRPSKAATDEVSPAPSRSAWHLPWPAWAAAGVTAATLLLVAGLWILRGWRQPHRRRHCSSCPWMDRGAGSRELVGIFAARRSPP